MNTTPDRNLDFFGLHWRYPASTDFDRVDALETYIDNFPDSILVPVMRKEIAFIEWINGWITREEAESRRESMIVEHTYGTYIYAKMIVDWRTEEIGVYYRNDGVSYKTSGDNEPERREAIISAFHRLY